MYHLFNLIKVMGRPTLRAESSQLNIYIEDKDTLLLSVHKDVNEAYT